MTPKQLTNFMRKRHGKSWYIPAAKETGYSVSHLCHIATEGREVAPKLAAIVNLLMADEQRKKERP